MVGNGPVGWLDDEPFPSWFADPDQLDDFLSRPSRALAADLAAIDGDIIVVGVGGKMGPTLARLARNAAPDKSIVGVARFSEAGLRERLHAHGVETIACDLLDRSAVAALPQIPNVIFMAGRKFGAQTDPALTWAMNVHVPAIVAAVFRASRIVAFSPRRLANAFLRGRRSSARKRPRHYSPMHPAPAIFLAVRASRSPR